MERVSVHGGSVQRINGIGPVPLDDVVLQDGDGEDVIARIGWAVRVAKVGEVVDAVGGVVSDGVARDQRRRPNVVDTDAGVGRDDVSDKEVIVTTCQGRNIARRRVGTVVDHPGLR